MVQLIIHKIMYIKKSRGSVPRFFYVENEFVHFIIASLSKIVLPYSFKIPSIPTENETSLPNSSKRVRI